MRRILMQLGQLLSVRGLAIALGLVQTVLMTRVFGPEVFGMISFALSLGALALLVVSGGLDQVLMRDIARVGPDSVVRSARWRDIRALIQRMIVPAALIAGAGGAALFAFTDLGGTYSVALTGVALMLPVVLVRKYLGEMALGTKAVLRSMLGTQIAYPALMAAGALVVWLAGWSTGIEAVMVIYATATLGSLAVMLALTWPILQRIRAGTGGTPDTNLSPGRRGLMVSGGHFALVSLGFMLGQHIDVLLTGVLAGPEDVSLVRIAARVAELAAMMRFIAILQYKPLLAEAHGRGEPALLQRHASTLAVIFLVTGVPITAGLWILAEDVMGIFGPEFVEGAWAMRIYVLGVFFTMLCGPCNAVLSFCGHERYASRIIWAALVVNLVLDLILIPHYGALGCAIANMSSLVIVGIASLVLCRRLLGIDTTVVGALRSHRARRRERPGEAGEGGA